MATYASGIREEKRLSSSPRATHNPTLFQINTRVLMQDLSRSIGRKASLDDIPDGTLDRLAQQGFEWVWFLGVWQTGAAGRTVSRENKEWREEFLHTLPDFTPDDVCGSCFAITDYNVAKEFGGNAALQRLRDRVHRRGMRLLLDFVPNHTALDHPWVRQHPEYYVHGTEEQLAREPRNYIRMQTGNGSTVLAYGRDPYFPGWPDTLQLNYAEPLLQAAMQQQLLSVADRCDGVRCDMAMLILPEVFQRTWGLHAQEFWPKAIEAVRASRPDFLFMAEVYWDLEWALQQDGFSYTYDKRLYDRLRDGHAHPVRDHFRADMDFQRRSARFLENHDEPRAAATFPVEMHRAAAVLTYLCPGLRFFHDGQFEGRKKKISVHLGRRPDEAVDSSLLNFYERLLPCVNRRETRDGDWQLLDCMPAWDGNWTVDCFICFAWRDVNGKNLLVAVNYAPNRSQCYVKLPFEELQGRTAHLKDLMGSDIYDRQGDQLLSRGLYLDLPPWGYNVFDVTA